MATATGYILILPGDRHALFSKHSDEDLPFAEPVAEFTHSRNAPLLCFIMTQDRQITHLARGKRGSRAGTLWRRLNVADAMKLEHPVPAASIEADVPRKVRYWASQRLSSGGLLSPKVFPAIVDALIRLVPSSAGTLRRFGQERAQRIAGLSERGRAALATQQMAVVTAISLAGLSREALLDWDPGPDSSPLSFLDGLPAMRLREDAMVVHDLMTLPGHEFIATLPCAAAVFESHKCRLTVLLANRLPLEELTGTDLIYYNEKYHSFVMVQYKAMERENNETFLRLPDAQLSAEVTRMRALRSELLTYPAGSATDEFRLSDNPFFLKLCSRIVFNPDDATLTPGMYIPLDYWDRLSADPVILGPRGGKAISYRNVGRYLDNTEFVSFVAKAWVGTTAGQSDGLQAAIRTTLETGKAAAIGIKTDLAPDGPDLIEGDQGPNRVAGGV